MCLGYGHQPETSEYWQLKWQPLAPIPEAGLRPPVNWIALNSYSQRSRLHLRSTVSFVNMHLRWGKLCPAARTLQRSLIRSGGKVLGTSPLLTDERSLHVWISNLCRRVVFNWNLTPGVYRHEKKSDLHQAIWPEGFYDVSASICSLSHVMTQQLVRLLWPNSTQQSCTHMASLCKVSLMEHLQAYCRLLQTGRLHLTSSVGRPGSQILHLQAMRKFARLRRPVYITETGIADKSDNLRAEWAESYFKAVSMDSNPAYFLVISSPH